jgi:hypothetical protein
MHKKSPHWLYALCSFLDFGLDEKTHESSFLRREFPVLIPTIGNLKSKI